MIKNSRSPSRIEVFKRDCKFQASHPPNPYFCGKFRTLTTHSPQIWGVTIHPPNLRGESLVAPYCAIPRDYLSDTPLLRAMGFLVSQHGQLSAIPPPPFLSISPFESMRSGGAIPPLKRGISAILARYPMKNKAKGCDTPLCDTISKGYCAIWGGISHWATKGESSKTTCFTVFFEGHFLNLGGEIFTPQIWGVWVFREGQDRTFQAQLLFQA